MVNEQPLYEAPNGENAEPENTASDNQGRKAPQRSVYLFPAYGFNTALDIARRVEENGGGNLQVDPIIRTAVRLK